MTIRLPGTDPPPTPPTSRETAIGVVRAAAGMAAWIAALFGAAGRLDWAAGWVMTGLCLGGLLVNFILIRAKNPELFRERWRRRKDTKRFDRILLALYVPVLFAVPVVAGLDARFGWSALPGWAGWAGAALFVLGHIPMSWAMAVNPHLEATVRIQRERGHRAVATGPYAIVRHPMYSGLILQQVGTAALLGSAWSFLPVAAFVAVLAIRTALEDRTLQAELPGYREYAARTRHRLIPLVW